MSDIADISISDPSNVLVVHQVRNTVVITETVQLVQVLAAVEGVRVAESHPIIGNFADVGTGVGTGDASGGAAAPVIVVTAESLRSGNWINFAISGGVTSARKAVALPGFRCDGFVKADYPAGVNAEVIADVGAQNEHIEGVSAGTLFLSLIPGIASNTPPPEGQGYLFQRIGYAVTPSVAIFNSTATVKGS